MQLSEAQQECLNRIYHGDKSTYLISGAVGSGKTMLAAILAGGLFRKYVAQGDVLFVGYSRESLEKNIGPQLEMFGFIDEKKSTKESFWMAGKRAAIYGGYDIRRASALRGSNASLVIVDEATTIHQSMWEEIERRLRKGPRPLLIATTNPDSPSHWLYKDLIEQTPSYAEVISLTMDDNPSLLPIYKDKLKEKYSKIPFLYDRFIKGKWAAGAGKIYDFTKCILKEKTTTEKVNTFFHREIKTFWGVDFGMRNPTALVKGELTPDRTLYITDEVYLDSKEGETRSVGQIAQIIAEKCRDALVLIDPSASPLKVELEKFHPGLRFKNADNEVIEGIMRVQNLLSNGKLFISERCKNLIREAEGYEWQAATEKSDREMPVKKADHCADSLRYLISESSLHMTKGRGGFYGSNVKDYVGRRTEGLF